MKEFKLFGIPPEADEFLTIGFLIIFLLTVTINYNVCGGGAVAVYKEHWDIEPNEDKAEKVYNELENSTGIFFNNYGMGWENIGEEENAKYDYFRNNFVYFIQQETNMYFKQSNKGFWFGVFLYWVGVPILCYYYAFFKFKKGMWERARKAEDLYNSVYKEKVTG